MLYRSIKTAKNNKIYEQWTHWFEDAGPNRYTLEGCPAGLRVVFTADPENTKAILTQQFQDFGKG